MDRQGVSARVWGWLQTSIVPYCQLYSNTIMQYDMEMIISEPYNDTMQKEMPWEFTEIKISKNKHLIFC